LGGFGGGTIHFRHLGWEVERERDFERKA